MAGGYTNTVEVWSPTPAGLNCALPKLPEAMITPTVDWIADKLVVCHQKKKCYKLDAYNKRWVDFVKTKHKRYGHTSAVLDEGILLMGGYYSQSTTEVVLKDGSKTVEGFTLSPGRRFHCSIQIDKSTVVLTGGRGTLRLVNKYSGLGLHREPVVDELASLNHGRYLHACGFYKKSGTKVTFIDYLFDNVVQMLIVAGGQGAGSSTEVLDFSRSGSAWRIVDSLPSARSELSGGQIGDLFFVSGGLTYHDDTFAWMPETEQWSTLKTKLKNGRYAHDTAEIPRKFAKQFC